MSSGGAAAGGAKKRKATPKKKESDEGCKRACTRVASITTDDLFDGLKEQEAAAAEEEDKKLFKYPVRHLAGGSLDFNRPQSARYDKRLVLSSCPFVLSCFDAKTLQCALTSMADYSESVTMSFEPDVLRITCSANKTTLIQHEYKTCSFHFYQVKSSFQCTIVSKHIRKLFGGSTSVLGKDCIFILFCTDTDRLRSILYDFGKQRYSCYHASLQNEIEEMDEIDASIWKQTVPVQFRTDVPINGPSDFLKAIKTLLAMDDSKGGDANLGISIHSSSSSDETSDLEMDLFLDAEMLISFPAEIDLEDKRQQVHSEFKEAHQGTYKLVCLQALASVMSKVKARFNARIYKESSTLILTQFIDKGLLQGVIHYYCSPVQEALD